MHCITGVQLAVLVLAAARAVRAVPCYPDQWEGVVEVIGASMGSSWQYLTQGRNVVAFDYTNKRQATNETFEMNGDKTIIHTIMDFTKNIMYEIQGGTCTRTAITQPMSRICVPDNAVRTGDFYLGAGDRTTPATGFSYNISIGTWTFLYLSPPDDVTGAWIPVAEIRQAGLSGATTMSTSSYTNVTLGIKDVSVFNPPPQCRQAPTL